MELQLFDLDQYTAPPAPISEDGDGDYENPQYITPKLYGYDGGKTKALRELYKTAPRFTLDPQVLACRLGIPTERIQGMAITDGHLFVSVPYDQFWAIGLTDRAKAIAKLVTEHLPNDAELLDEQFGTTSVRLEWMVCGDKRSKLFDLTKERRNYGTGWASLENRLSRGKYEQWYLHYQLPKQPKRSKYVSGKQLAKVKEMIALKKPVTEILEVIGSKKKGV